ncbi:MAG: hypothetical protein ACI3Z7_07205 [Candidatus Aphodosoma sp.]
MTAVNDGIRYPMTLLRYLCPMVHKTLLILAFAIVTMNASIYAHSSWQEHVSDMMEVFGFEPDTELRNWMKFISSDMIDRHEPFYSGLKEKHPGFTCKHRLLFHWGYDAEPWNGQLEEKVRAYCETQDLNAESNIRIFKSELKAEQKRRNALMNRRTEELFGFAHGGRDASYARFFVTMAYNIHLIGDYTPDNRDLDGVQSMDNIIRSTNNAILKADPKLGKPLVKKIDAINRTYPDVQEKSARLLSLLKTELPAFIIHVQKGSIYRRLSARGFKVIQYSDKKHTKKQ